MEKNRIRHTVIFCLRHEAGSREEERFLADGKAQLANIPSVEGFELLRQVSPKNSFKFGFSMEFADQSAYAAYNAHPDHVRFVRERWQTEVADFMEIDYQGVDIG